MIAFLTLLVPAYSAEIVFDAPAKDRWYQYATATVLTDRGTVAGFNCEFTGRHGETEFAKPFVREGDKLVWLPLGDGKYGRVFGGDDKALYGEIMVDYRQMPVAWVPDTKLGWALPHLNRIGTQPGSAFSADPDGRVWIRNGDGAPDPGLRGIKAGRPINYKGNFDPVGIDGKGVIWGNMFGGRSGSFPSYDVVLRFDGKRVYELRDYARLTAVNRIGIAVGETWSDKGGNYELFTTDGYKFTKISLPQNDLCEASDINDRGDIVGFYGTFKRADSSRVPFVIRSGRRMVLDRPDSTLTDFRPLLIGNDGTIIAEGTRKDGGTRLYRLRPTRAD